MSLQKLNNALQLELDDLYDTGSAKGKEMVIVGIKPAEGGKGPRYYIEDLGDKEFLKMNSNSYLGMSLRKEVIETEEEAAREFGVGPGAVRFISGTYKAHTALEERLAKFHNREAGMIFSSAYVTSMGVLFPLITKDTVLISDELNHNCIIMAIKLSKPAVKGIYLHNDMKDFETKILDSIGKGKRVLAITDGIFSMRGDNAPLDNFVEICQRHNDKFDEGIVSIIDDSHGIGSFGKTGRGTEEFCDTKVDIVIGTLGKSFGVNGGYVVSSRQIIEYLREKAPMYIYSNPITVSEASAALKAIEILDSPEGLRILEHLRKMTKRFEAGLKKAGYETIEGEHPVVPIMVRDTKETSKLVKYLIENGILATGLNFPVVPKGDEEIRIQISADHTIYDIDYAIEVLQKFKESL
jgi:glycine C-acetyltransferase